MKSIIKQIAETNKAQELAAAENLQQENSQLSTESGRRNFFKNTAIGGLSLSASMFLRIEDTIAQATSKVSRASSPSDLKITDLRYVLVEHLGRRIPILRMDTNQGIYGLGEVRDGGDERYALMLKSRLVGENPCNVEKIFKVIKHFGNNGRMGGGVSGVEMALWDLAGKAFNAPCCQLLGGRFRDKIRLYADTHGDKDFEKIIAAVKHRVDVQGFTWLKMTRVRNILENVPADKRIPEVVRYVEAIRNHVGYDVQISVDHFRDRDMNTMIRLGKALEPYRLAWMEEVIPWNLTDELKAVTQAIDVPTCTGEDIYLKEGFQKMCDIHAVDIVHPDIATSGGLLETKKIGDYAEEKGIGMAMHFAGTPVSFMANVHCAAATENCLVLEFHPDDIEEWARMVKPTGRMPLITKGFANVPLDAPGLGIELNEAEIKRIQHPSDKSFFAPTTQWNDRRSSDGMGTGIN